MLFTLKKFVSWFLDPANICLLLIAPGIVLLWTKKYLRHGRILVTAGIGVLAIFSNGAVARWISVPLEMRYKPIPDLSTTPAEFFMGPIDYISIFGGGHADTPIYSANNKLNVHALARLVEGVRIAKAYPAARLILSGRGYGGASDAEIMKQAAVSLGVEASRIVQFDQPKDTREEADAVRALAQGRKLVVVTSAMHLPRAVAFMRRRGLDPIPAPTDYLARPIDDFSIFNQLWNGDSLTATSSALHEYLGLLWAWATDRA